MNIVVGFLQEVTVAMPTAEAEWLWDTTLQSLILKETSEGLDSRESNTVTFFVEKYRRKLTLAPALHLAAKRHSCTKYVKLLLEAGADANSTNSEGKTVLFGDNYCAHNVRLLLEAGADVNITDARGNTALRDVCKDITWQDKDRNRVLHQEAVIKLLLAAGASADSSANHKINIGGFDNSTAFMLERVLLLMFTAGSKELFIQMAHNNFTKDLRNLFPRAFLQIQQHQPQGSSLKAQFFPADWDDLDLKNQCRKVIRKHLLTLDLNTNLFTRVPQLQMTHERAGLPEELVSYLLYDQQSELNIDWVRIEESDEDYRQW